MSVPSTPRLRFGTGRVVLTVLCLSALALAACSSGNSSSSTSANTVAAPVDTSAPSIDTTPATVAPSSSATESSAPAETTALAAPAPTSGAGGTLRVAIAEAPGVLDPHVFTGNFLLLDMLYEPLVKYGKGGVIEPALAESFVVAPDGLKATFTLRKGVTFHDGTTFDAAAVKWNFDRWVGVKDYNFFKTSEVISEVKVVDPQTVELLLSKPYPPLLGELAIVRPVRFLSPTSAGADGKFAKAVGTGPWKLDTSSETGATFSRNGSYWDAKPTQSSVVFSVIPDSQTRAAALRSGEQDLIGGAYLAPMTPVEAKDLQGADGVSVLVGEPDTTLFMAFNTKGQAGEKAVREAISHALDTSALNNALYAGFGKPASTFFPPSVPDAGTAKAIVYDTAMAKSILDAAGWKQSGKTREKAGKTLELTLLIPSAPVHGIGDARTLSEAVAASLGEVGIKVTIKAVDSGAYFDERLKATYDLAFEETYGAPYDPSSTSVSYLTTTGGDVPVWKSPGLDTLVNTAVFADDAARPAAYQAVFDYLGEQTAFVPITYRPRFWAAGKGVSGFTVPLTEYTMDLTGVMLTR